MQRTKFTPHLKSEDRWHGMGWGATDSDQARRMAWKSVDV